MTNVLVSDIINAEFVHIISLKSHKELKPHAQTRVA